MKFDGRLETWLKKFQIKDQLVRSVRLQGLKLLKSMAKLKKIKFWWSIRGPIEQIKNQGSNYKRRSNSGAGNWVW